MELKEFQRPRMWMRPRWLVRRVLGSWPFLIWLGFVALAAYLYMANGVFSGMTGVVETRAETIAPLETARLMRLEVELGQRVQAGQVLARMDTSLLDARMTREDAQMLEAEGAIAGYQRDILQLHRQFRTAIADAEIALQTERLHQQRDLAELAELAQELKRRQGLLTRNLISEQDVVALRPRMAAIQKAVDSYPSLIAVHASHLEEAKKDWEDLKTWLRAENGETISEAIGRKAEARGKILTANRQELLLQKQNYVLRATSGGVVSRIYHTPGEVIQAGEAILRLVGAESNRIIGFLPEGPVDELTVGLSVNILCQSRRSAPLTATVESIAPEVQALPGRMSPSRGQVVRGRRVLLRLDNGRMLTPGETVMISKIGRELPEPFNQWRRALTGRLDPKCQQANERDNNGS
jgi:HlyD family secretion protein